MVEPVLHFAIPFAALRAVGLDSRKATFASFLALTPDLDVIFHVHRSPTHSLVILAVGTICLVAMARRRQVLRMMIMLAAFGILTHLFLDLFQFFTPILWPLSNQSFWISGDLKIHSDYGALITSSMRLLMEPTNLIPFVSFNEPVLTSLGVGIAAVLLVPVIMKAHLDRRE